MLLNMCLEFHIRRNAIAFGIRIRARLSQIMDGPDRVNLRGTRLQFRR